MIGVVLVGCAPSKPKSATKPPEKPIFEKGLTVNSPQGQILVRDETTRQPKYHVTWKDAKIELSDQGVFAGSMDGVQGEMYQDGKVVNTFSADHARAERQTQMLILSGHVRLKSKIYQSRLTCDRVDWLAGDKIIKARGNVEVTGAYGTLGPAEALWATQDLRVIATPDVFKKP